MDNWLVSTVLDHRSLLLSLETKSALSRTQRKVIARILVNPGQGCQRSLLCQHVSTAKVSTVLATRLDPASLSGLPGVYFAMADVGAGSVEVRGPTGTRLVCDAWRSFVKRRYPELRAKDVESQSGVQARVEQHEGFRLASLTLQDLDKVYNSVCIWCLMAPSSSNNRQTESSSSSSESEEDSAAGGSVGENSSDDEDNAKPSREKEESCEPGPMCGSNREQDMKTICYLINFERAPIIGIIDCSSLEDIERISRNPHLAFRCSVHRPKLLVHVASYEIVSSQTYKTWLSSLDHSLSHQYSHIQDSKAGKYKQSDEFVNDLKFSLPGGSSFPSNKVYQFGFPDVLPVERNDLLETRVPEPRSLIAQGTAGRFEIDLAPNTDKEILEKARKMRLEVPGCNDNGNKSARLTDPNEIVLEHASPSQPVISGDPARQSVSGVPLQISNNLTPQTEVDFFPSLVFLGTGAAKPSAIRGLSCILVRLSASQSFMLDAGEDWLYQLERCAGQQSIEDVVNGLSHVWISHHHLDHHGGLLTLIDRKTVKQQPLVIFAPKSVRTFIETILHQSVRGLIHLVACESAKNHSPHLVSGTCRVDHCFDAHAIGLRLGAPNEPEISLIYSGDTRPCARKLKTLIEGRHDDIAHPLVLIHECTFGKDLASEAKAKMHSTLEEACDVAFELRATVLIATHASQRYPRGILPDKKRLSDPFPIVQAHDLMTLSLSNLRESVLPCLFQFEREMNKFIESESSTGE